MLNDLGSLRYLYISYDALEDVLKYIDTSKVDLIIKK